MMMMIMMIFTKHILCTFKNATKHSCWLLFEILLVFLFKVVIFEWKRSHNLYVWKWMGKWNIFHFWNCFIKLIVATTNILWKQTGTWFKDIFGVYSSFTGRYSPLFSFYLWEWVKTLAHTHTPQKFLRFT